MTVFIMEQDLTGKIQELQKNFYELNNFFGLSIIANQAYSVEDLLMHFSDFL